MSRILQIRRGTAAQNNNFTGLAGEITMDTDAKTLRVHDGETLGGFALARADATPGTSDFDIASVSDEFWTALFARFGGTSAPSIMVSPDMAIGNAATYECVFNTTLAPIFANVVMVCQSDDGGYSAGDAVASFGIGTRTNPAPYTFTDANGLHLRIFVGDDAFWVSHKTTGVATNIDKTKWRIRARVYC